MVVLAVATVCAISQIPMRERLRAQARIGALLSTAPVLLVGDSISYLAAPRLLCDEAVFNASIPGDRIADLVADAREYAPRRQTKRVVVAVGVNDAWPHHRTIASWIADYRRLVTLYAGHDLVLVEINPPEVSRQRFPKPLDLNFIAQPNEAIRAIAAKTGARLVPAPQSIHTSDGLHPTPAGTDLWRARLSQAACI